MDTSDQLRVAYAFAAALRELGVTDDDLTTATADPARLWSVVAALGLNPKLLERQETAPEFAERTRVESVIASVRVHNKLRGAGLLYVEELAVMSEADLRALQGVGQSMINEIRATLEPRGFGLREPDESFLDALKRVYGVVLKAPARLAFFGSSEVVLSLNVAGIATLQTLLAYSLSDLHKLERTVKDFNKLPIPNVGIQTKKVALFKPTELERIKLRLTDLGLELHQERK